MPYRIGSLYQDRVPTALLSRRIGPNLVPGVPSDTGLFCPKRYLVVNCQSIHSSRVFDHKSSNADQLKLLAQSSLFKSVPVPSYAWSRRRRRRIIPGLGMRWAVPFSSLQPRGFATFQKQQRKCLNFVFSFDLNSKLNDTIVGSLVRSTSRVFNDIYSRGQILYGRF